MTALKKARRQFLDVDPDTVMVAQFPCGLIGGIWAEKFIGVKVGENPDGTIRVQVGGPAPNDFTQAVFRRQV